MILTRREGLMAMGGVALAVNAPAIAAKAVTSVQGSSAKELATDEAFWRSVAGAYRLDSRWLMLNGGGSNPHPIAVTEALQRYDAQASSAPRPHNYVLGNRIDDHRRRLATLMDCSPEEVAITRNTTEGLNIVGWGLPLREGDEVVMSDVDEYYAGKVFEQRARRDGIRLRKVQLPIEPTAAQTLAAFSGAMTSNTRLLVASHLADGLGYVLPISELAQLAHDRGAQLLVDGALSFGQVPVSMKQFGCDYFATSLHKWLNAPLGTGALFVRRDRVEELWPLYGTRHEPGDIRKFEDIGTRSGPTIAAIGDALDFYEQLGPERKAERLKYLLSVVMAELASAEGVRIITEPDESKRTGLARVVVTGLAGAELMNVLREEYGIFTFGNWPGPIDGVYISPNVFNSADQMRQFAQAVRAIAGNA